MRFRRHFIRHLSCLALAVGILPAVSCQQEDGMSAPLPRYGEVRLTLSSEPDVFVETRTVQSVSDISSLEFFISGTGEESGQIANQPISFSSNGGAFTAFFESGTYTLTVRTRQSAAEAAEGNNFGAPSYEGTSAQFSVNASVSTPVTIALGTPRNAKVTVVEDVSFSSLYTFSSLTLTAGNREVTLTDPSSQTAYFLIPADNKLHFTLHAAAKSGSHAQEISENGTQGTVTIEGGHAYVLTLKANPVTGVLLPVVEGEYGGTFDTKRKIDF